MNRYRHIALSIRPDGTSELLTGNGLDRANTVKVDQDAADVIVRHFEAAGVTPFVGHDGSRSYNVTRGSFDDPTAGPDPTVTSAQFEPAWASLNEVAYRAMNHKAVANDEASSKSPVAGVVLLVLLVALAALALKVALSLLSALPPVVIVLGVAALAVVGFYVGGAAILGSRASYDRSRRLNEKD